MGETIQYKFGLVCAFQTHPGLDSDVLHLNVLGTDMIIVNSAKAATALFERKSGLYSDR